MFGSSATGSGTLSIGIGGTGKDANNQQVVGVPGVSGEVYQYAQLDATAAEFQLNYVNAVMNGQVARFAYADPTGAPPPANADYPLSYAQQDFYA